MSRPCTMSTLDTAVMLLATVGKLGLVAHGGGSLGALVAVPIAWMMAPLPRYGRLGLAVLVSIIAMGIVTRYMRHQCETDPQAVVVDELAGCLVTLACVPFEWPWVAAGYLAFRALDIFKPWPIHWVERAWKGPTGVVGDDLVAGLIAGGALAAVRAFC